MWRLRLIIDDGDPYYQMALDEAMLLLRSAGVIPDTLRLYVFNPSAATIGYFQSLSRSINKEFILENKIPVTRRITGGGSVYHDARGEITYAVIAGLERVPRDILESYRFITMGVIYAARSLGANADYVPLNDGVIDGKKFSGQAQTRKRNTLLQHGTFMYNTDLDMLAKILRAPRKKLRDKGVSSIRERVTTVSEVVGRRISREEAVEALIHGFSKALDAELVPGKLTSIELELAKTLRWKYMSWKWIELRP